MPSRKQTSDEKFKDAFLSMLEETPLARIKVSRLVKEAGLSRGTFYSYYESVYDILEEIELTLFDGIPKTKNLSRTVKSDNSLHDDLLMKLAYLKSQMDLVQLLLGPNGDPYFLYRLNRFLAPDFESFEAQHKDSLEQTLILESLNGARTNILRWWIYHPNHITIEELANFLATYAKKITELVEEN